jgi:hypothetical protein
VKWTYDGVLIAYLDMSRHFEQPETTWTCEPDTCELYTTSRRLWLRAIARNPRFLEAIDLEPGYRIAWKTCELRSAETLVRPAPGGDLLVRDYLTPSELAARVGAAERLRAVRQM